MLKITDLAQTATALAIRILRILTSPFKGESVCPFNRVVGGGQRHASALYQRLVETHIAARPS